jgi:hypothetical protein
VSPLGQLTTTQPKSSYKTIGISIKLLSILEHFTKQHMTFTHKIQHLGLCYIITFLLKLKMACPKASNNRVQQQNWHLSNVWESPLLCWYGEVHIRTVCESGTKIRSWYWQVCNMEVVMRVSYKDTERKKIVTESLCE